MSTYIEPTATVAEAWRMTIANAREATSGRKVNVITTITDPRSEGDPVVRSAVDAFLSSNGRQLVEEVAETIFPVSLLSHRDLTWQPGLRPQDERAVLEAEARLYEMYVDMLEVILSANGNAHGTYFSRMITWPGKAPGGVNQLADRIVQLRQRRLQGVSAFNALDIDIAADALPAVHDDIRGLQVYAATDRRIRGFPCLTHVDLTLLDGVIHMSAVYRHQYLVTKAYANLLGLSRLLVFIANQSGYAAGELTVNATLADCQFAEFGKDGVDQLLTAAHTDPAGTR